MNKFALVASILVCACQPAPEQAPARSPALAANEIRAGSPLDEILERLDRELVLAMAGRMEGEALDNFRRAEAISDRLLEARLPFDWITAEQYSLRARLRQIQSAADRVLAQVETGAPRDTVLSDLTQLRIEVVRLRQIVAAGGGRAPPPLELLLSDSMQERPRPRPAPVQQADTATVPATTTGG